MKIHRIAIKDFRGVASCDVEFPETGITVIEGENEIGKSSLIEALFLLIDTQDSSNAAAVRSVRPKHTGHDPVVSAEISSGDYRFEYEKRYGERAGQRYTRLTLLQPRREQLTGPEAHERVAQILRDTTDEVLWRALRLQQGVEVKQEQLLAGSSLGAALDAAAGAPQGSERDDTLFARVSQEYSLYFTRTGQDRDTLRTPREADVKAAEAVAELEQQLADLERDADRFDALTRELAHLSVQETEQRELVANLATEWDKVAEQQHDVDRLYAAAELAAGRAEAAEHRWKQRREAIAAALGTSQRVDDLTKERDRLVPAADAGKQEVEAAARNLATQRGRLSTAQAAQGLRSGDEIFIRDRGDLERMQERLRNVEEAQPAIDEADAFLETCKIGAESLAQLEEAHAAVVRANARLEAAAPAVKVHALADFDLFIGDEPERLVRGQEREIDGALGVDLRVADLATITVTAGGDASQLQDRLLAVEAEFRRLAEEHGVFGVADAQSSSGGGSPQGSGGKPSGSSSPKPG